MSPGQLGILVVGGLAGWWAVSYLFDRGRKAASSDAEAGATRGAAVGAAESTESEPTILELGERWPGILGVARTAGMSEIDAAYAARRVELGRRRYAPGASEAELRSVLRDLRTLDAAYEFVRAARSGAN